MSVNKVRTNRIRINDLTMSVAVMMTSVSVVALIASMMVNRTWAIANLNVIDLVSLQALAVSTVASVDLDGRVRRHSEWVFFSH